MKPLAELLSLRPGGAPWLMRHELRLFAADSAAAVSRALQRAPNQRAMPSAVLGWMVAVYAVLHLAAWNVLPTLPFWQPTESISQRHLDGAVVAVLFILMLSAAMIRCVHVMYSRSDLDLLLCSPVPGSTILRARLGGVVLGTLLLALFLVTPVIHVGILTDRPRLLALYPGLVAMAMIAASLGMMFVIQLARLIGPRYTSLFAQVLGTVVIVWLCYMPQVQQAIPVAIKTSLSHLLDDGAVLGPASPLWLPVQALQGSPLPLLLFCLAALGSAQLAAVLLQHSFLRLLQQGRNSPRGIARLAFGLRLHFAHDLRWLLIYKEWLLLVRQPMFLGQIAARFVWLVVAFAAAGTDSLRPLVIAAIAVYATAGLASILTRLIEAGEAAWDLLSSSPLAPATISTAKRRAALIPALLLGVPTPLWLGIANPTLGILTAIAVAGACGSAHRLNLARRHLPAAQMVTSVREVLSNGVWVLLLLIAYAILG